MPIFTANTQTERDMTKEIAVLAGGCFWCTEAIYLDVAGVETVVSGYTGGQTVDPRIMRESTSKILAEAMKGK